MKTINSITSVLKLVIKYGAYIAIAVKVVQFAVDEFEKLNADEKEPAKAVENE